MTRERLHSGKALRGDCLTREIWGRAAIAVGMSDKDEALAVCRDLHAMESDYEIVPKRGATERIASVAKEGAFHGYPIVAKYAGACCVCRQSFSVGADILYHGDTKRSAHARCGEPEARR